MTTRNDEDVGTLGKTNGADAAASCHAQGLHSRTRSISVFTNVSPYLLCRR